MANWKKMAEAFGRAVQDPERSRAGDRLVRNAATRFERPREKYEPEYDRVTREPWTDEAQDVNRAFVKGELHGWKDASDAKNAGKDFDEMTETRSNATLKQTASDEWDDAFARRKQDVRDQYGKDYPQDLAEEGADAFEKQLWEAVDALKAQGVSAQDILDMLKGNN